MMMFLWVSAAFAKTWFVAPDGSGDFTSIQDALDSASAYDAVVVEAGTYNEGSAYNATYAGGLLIERPVSIIGAGPDQVTINVTFDSSYSRIAAVTLTPITHDAWIEGVTFQHSVPGSVSGTSARGYVGVTAIAAAKGYTTFQNVVFAMPTDTNRGLVETGSGSLNLIFDQVTADFFGGAPASIGVISTLGADSRITSSIIYNCSGATDASDTPEFPVSYTDIYGYDGAEAYGTANINADPMFADASGGDWTLQSGSPAIDAGTAGTVDLDGSAADMGAFGGSVDNYPVDLDGDGYYTGVGLGGDPDCDDDNADVSPGATEVCDTLDNDCDGDTDEPSAVDASTWYYDNDGDGYGVFDDAVVECFAPTDYASQAGDCDDENPATAPGSEEYCNDIDDNCNDIIDDNSSDALTWYADLDGDGYGDETVSVVSCEQPSGYVNVGTDCNDSDSEVWLSVPDLPASCEQTTTSKPPEGGCAATPTAHHRGAVWLLSLAGLLLLRRRR